MQKPWTVLLQHGVTANQSGGLVLDPHGHEALLLELGLIHAEGSLVLCTCCFSVQLYGQSNPRKLVRDLYRNREHEYGGQKAISLATLSPR